MATRSVQATKAARPVKKQTTKRSAAAPGLVVLVATRKGAWLFRSDARRKAWQVDGPHFLGHTISHLMLDPRDGRTLLAAAKTGHLGPTVFRSTNLGRTWKEAAKPPAFAKPAEGGAPARTVDHTFWLTPGHASERGTWYAGTSPQGLFRSEDGGVTWAPFSGINDDPQYREWMGSVQDGTPDGPKMHSIIVDPRDPAHLYFAMSSGGVHESTDGGRSWSTLVKGLEVVGGFDPTTLTFHDPHVRPAVPEQPRSALPAEPLRHLPAGPARRRVGAHRRQDAQAGRRHRLHHGRAPARRRHGLGFPDGRHTVWPRTSPQGRPAAYVTRNAGKTWTAPGLRPARRPGLVDGQAPGHDGRRAATPSACTWAPPAASCGRAATRAAAGPASPGTCPRSTPSRWPHWPERCRS